MTTGMLWLVGRRRGGGDEFSLPFDGTLVIGTDADCDWVLTRDGTDPGRVVLGAVGGRVRIEPQSARVFIGPNERLLEPRMCELPLKFAFAGYGFRIRATPPAIRRGRSATSDFEGLISDDRAASETLRSIQGRDSGVRHRSAEPGVHVSLMSGATRWAPAVLLGSVALVALVIGAAALAPNSLQALETSSIAAPLSPASILPASRPQFVLNAPTAELSPEQVLLRVSALLRSADFEPTVSATLAGTRVQVVGTAGAAEIDRLKRVLAKAALEDSALASLDVAVSVPDSTELPPLDVVQVVGGPQPYVVLSGGITLEPGGRHDGLTLIAIHGHRLILQGKRRFEYEW